MSRNTNRLAITALIAAGAGYIGGLLSAPRSGKQTRKKISKSASKVKTDGEKQLKKLHSDINGMIEDGEKQVTKARTKANKELKEALQSAKEARQKARILLTALHEGDADDPNLKAVLNDVSAAKNHLAKFIRTPQKKTKTKTRK